MGSVPPWAPPTIPGVAYTRHGIDIALLLSWLLIAVCFVTVCLTAIGFAYRRRRVKNRAKVVPVEEYLKTPKHHDTMPNATHQVGVAVSHLPLDASRTSMLNAAHRAV